MVCSWRGCCWATICWPRSSLRPQRCMKCCWKPRLVAAMSWNWSVPRTASLIRGCGSRQCGCNRGLFRWPLREQARSTGNMQNLWERACSRSFSFSRSRRLVLDLPITALQFLTNLTALFGLGETALVFAGLRLQRRHAGRFALIVHSHHGEEAAVGVTHRALADVLGHDLDTNFHRRIAGVVHRCQEGHQLTDVNRLAKNHLVH